MPRAESSAFVQRVPRLAEGVLMQRADGGLIRLLGPARRRGWLLRLFRLPQRAHVELDDIGTFVVERFGTASVGELARALAGHLRLEAREAEVALGDFLALLSRRGLVAIA